MPKTSAAAAAVLSRTCFIWISLLVAKCMFGVRRGEKTHVARPEGERADTALRSTLPIRSVSLLERRALADCRRKRALIEIIELAADGHAVREPRHSHPGARQYI